ncbi:MAG: HAD family hydrolase [Anaerolineales bacterium]
MEKIASSVAIFDLDYTLLEGDSEALWSQFLVEKGLVGKEFLERIQDYYRDYEQGSLDFIEYEEFLLGSLTLQPMEALVRLRDEYLERVRLVIRPAIAERVQWHSTQGHTLVMVTATNRFLAEPIAAILHFQNLICTEVKHMGDSYTNKVEGIPAFGQGKVKLLDQWLAGHALTLKDSWGYSDSCNDLPLLTRVAHPVAVTPDARLRTYALEHTWKIITEP